jgi:integrase
MKRAETESNQATVGQRQSHALKFTKAVDGRKQEIRGLWIRNGRYYARLNVEDAMTGVKRTRWVSLVDKDSNPVQTTAQAVEQLNRLRTQRVDNALPVLGRQPKFSDYAADYIKSLTADQTQVNPETQKLADRGKKASTVGKEDAILKRWSNEIGHLRLDQIRRLHVNQFISKRQKANASPRTINLDVITFRVLMKKALSDGLIQRLPTEGLQPLKTSAVERGLFTVADINNLCEAAHQTRTTEGGKEVPVTENAQEFSDYIRLMAYCGARRNEALGIKYSDIDWDNELLHIRRQVTHRGIEDLKNRELRAVDFNPKLKAHLLQMKERNKNASEWLFPSPQGGEKDIPAKTFRESLGLAKAKAKMPSFGFHDCRHHFISMCVMSGVDFMTIAKWVGHKDGGVLIGKVYGHLANEHRKAMAGKVTFEPVVVNSAVNQ